MQVTLLAHTPEPERVVAAAARLCYSPASAAELKENISDEEIGNLL
ncbi:MAG TPA: thymidylate synthase (FAD), partial [Actinobacteria bacterium]|nr:thymidylate synthase (FAD) [Actinomycetes bacterium]HEX21224.1 thymidylate synthase (FAD) [Actinomycetota bacterium]